MAFIEDSAPQKNAGIQLSRRFFAVPASTNAGRRNYKEKKKDDPSLAIGENYINKNVSFLLTFYLRMFLLIANH